MNTSAPTLPSPSPSKRSVLPPVPDFGALNPEVKASPKEAVTEDPPKRLSGPKGILKNSVSLVPLPVLTDIAPTEGSTLRVSKAEGSAPAQRPVSKRAGPRLARELSRSKSVKKKLVTSKQAASIKRFEALGKVPPTPRSSLIEGAAAKLSAPAIPLKTGVNTKKRKFQDYQDGVTDGPPPVQTNAKKRLTSATKRSISAKKTLTIVRRQ
jgi:hypothetical protein